MIQINVNIMSWYSYMQYLIKILLIYIDDIDFNVIVNIFVINLNLMLMKNYELMDLFHSFWNLLLTLVILKLINLYCLHYYEIFFILILMESYKNSLSLMYYSVKFKIFYPVF